MTELAFQSDAFQGDAFQAGPQITVEELLDQTAVIYAPKINLSVSVGLIDQTSVIFEFDSLTLGNIDVETNLIDQTAQIHSPQVNLKIVIGLLDQTAVIHEFDSLTLGNALYLGLINNTAIIPTPTEVVAPSRGGTATGRVLKLMVAEGSVIITSQKAVGSVQKLHVAIGSVSNG
jgi:hypothetical protein